MCIRDSIMTAQWHPRRSLRAGRRVAGRKYLSTTRSKYTGDGLLPRCSTSGQDRSAPSVRCHAVASLTLGTMRSPQLGPKVYALAMFVVVTVTAGLLVAGLAVPAAALVGTSTKYVAQGIES